MALGMRTGSNVIRVNEGYGMGLVRSTSFGRKRVSPAAAVNDDMKFADDDDDAPSKKHCFPRNSAKKSGLGALPQDVLIRVLCGVDHDDLKRLFFVSKSIRQAAVLAKQMHFAYSTPRKTVGFQNSDVFGDFGEIEAPNAPKQSRVPRARLVAKKLGDISVALFSSDNEEDWPRKGLLLGSRGVEA